MRANDRQEGGTHYRKNGNAPQHWDLAVLHGWDYFQAQVIKYVMRWKDKHPTLDKRIEDLKKARHVLDKYIEEAEAGARFPALQPDDDNATPMPPITNADGTFHLVELYPNACARWACARCGTEVDTAPGTDPAFAHDCAAAKGYVQQD